MTPEEALKAAGWRLKKPAADYCDPANMTLWAYRNLRPEELEHAPRGMTSICVGANFRLDDPDGLETALQTLLIRAQARDLQP